MKLSCKLYALLDIESLELYLPTLPYEERLKTKLFQPCSRGRQSIQWLMMDNWCVWTVSGLSCSGLSLDCRWTVFELSLDRPWTVSGLSLVCLYTVSGLSLDWLTHGLTGFVLNVTRFVLKMTRFVINMAGFVINMTGFVLYITGWS